MKRYRAVEVNGGYWHIEEFTIFGRWRPIDVAHGEDGARERLRMLTQPRIIYPEPLSDSAEGK